MKTRLYMITFLILIWTGFSDGFDLAHVSMGIFFSTIISFFILQKQLDFRINILNLFSLVLYIIYELVFSSLEVAWDILTPKHRNNPTITSVALSCKNPTQISFLANLISLTPGTLVVDTADDDSAIVVHIMFGRKKDKIIHFIKHKLEPRVMRAIENA